MALGQLGHAELDVRLGCLGTPREPRIGPGADRRVRMDREGSGCLDHAPKGDGTPTIGKDDSLDGNHQQRLYWAGMEDQLQLAQLEAFLAVARAGTFSRAAEELLVSQPAVTARIQGLEHAVAASLFVRGRVAAA